MLDFFRKRKEKKDEEYLEKMILKIKNASNKELEELNSSYHNGIDMSRKMGDFIPKISLEIDRLVEEEMHLRGLKTLDDLEEEIWFARH